MALPDIPDTDWNAYQAAQFKQASDAAITGLTTSYGSQIDAIRASVAPANRVWVDRAVAAAQRYGVDPLIYVKQIRQESGFNPNAGSSEGARGIAQFTDPTAKAFGINAWNPDQSLDAGARYMRQNLDATGGDYRLALASYNAGGGNVAKYGQNIFNPSYLKSQGWSDFDANQPAAYIRSILGDQTPAVAPVRAQPTMGTQQPAPAANPNDAWNQKQAAAFGQAVQAGAPDTSAWSSITVPPTTAKPLSFRDHAQARIDALGGADATVYPDSAGAAAAGVVSPSTGIGSLTGQDTTSNPGGVRPSFGQGYNDMVGASSSPPSAVPDQLPTDNANLKDFASYATSKIASLSDPTASTTPTPYNDMAGATSGPTPAFGANPQDATSPIDQARAAGSPLPPAAPLTLPGVSTVTNALSVPARIARSMIAPPPDAPGGVVGAALQANPFIGMAANEAQNLYRGGAQANPNQPLLNRANEALDIGAQPFEKNLADVSRQVGAYSPPLGGVVSLAGHLASDPLIVASPVSPYLAAGTAAGALGGAVVSRAQGASPEQTMANVESGGNLGMLAGGGAEGVAHLAGPALERAGAYLGPSVGRLATEEAGGIRLPSRAPETFADHAAQVLGEAPPVEGAPAVAAPKDALSAIHEMYNGPAPQAPPKSPAQVVKAAGDAFVRQMTDRGAPLANFQNDVQKTLGRPLRVNEMAAELSRLNPDMAARVKIQEGLQPALQSVGQENLPALSDYLTAQHNIDVAKTLGQRVQAEALQAPLATTAAERQAQALNGRIRMYQRLRDEGVSAGDGTVVTHYDQLIADSQRELSTVNKRALRQVTAADAERAASAQAKGQAVTANRQFSGGINQNESQQALIQLQQVLGPERFARVEQAAQQVWKFADGIRQQAVDSGLWTPQLADQLRQDYPHYVPTKILDYMQEPGAIANGKSLSVTDQGLKRLTLEGTTKVREDPLASLVRAQYQMEALAGKNRAFNAFVKLNDHLPPDARIIKEVPDSYTATAHDAKVSGFVDGKRVTYVMPKEYETIVKQEAAAPIRGLAPAMQLYKSLLTSKNPAFVAGQIPLDALSYIIRETTRGGGPQALPGVMSSLFSAYGDALKGFGRQTYHGKTAEFLKGGGGMGGFFKADAKSVRQDVATLARPSPLAINSAADIGRIAKDILTLKPVEAIGERFEQAPRVASMKLAQKRGLNNVQAVINGRTVTMDFAQGGALAKQINQFIPFFNVGMQGLATPARTIRDNPRGALLTFLTLLAAPTVGAEVWNHADPQRAKDYADVPNYVKDRSIVLMLPVAAPVDQQAERRPQYVEIRTREFSPFVDLTRSVLQTALGQNTRSWQDLAGGAINAASPISTDSALGLFGSLVPPGVSTGVDLANNRSSYTGATIATKNSDVRASTLSKGLASGINAASDQAGLGLNVRPSQTEFAGRDLTGGAGQIARDVSNIASGQGSSGLPQDTPLLGQVTRRFVGGSVGQRLQTVQDQRVNDVTRPILREAGIYDITPVADHIGKIPLSNDEQAIYQETTNRNIESLLRSAARSPTYQKLSQPEKAAMVQKMMDDMRALAAQYTLSQIDETGLKNRLRAQFQAEMAATAGAGR